ncbi:hypothetical protein C8J57DRAFT_1584321 [Mycena rebaudengoi]|nr:hypothetical protein C8J57DRAFT_1584321 [Mycena rebaudengoi]
MSSTNPPQATAVASERFCVVCNKIVKFGRGGVANWRLHLNTTDHIKNAKEAENSGNSRQITSFFTTRPRAPAASRPTAAEVPPSASTSPVIDVDELPELPAISDPPIPAAVTDVGEVLLSRLRVAISTLPSSVPLAQTGDFISSFAVDPTTLVLPGLDAWEDVIHGAFDAFLLDGPRHKNTVQLSELIRRGELGMGGFLKWLEICFFQLKISPAMVEDRVQRIVQAMILLGASTSSPILPPSVTNVVPEEVPKKKLAVIAIGCPGQELPTDSGKPAFLSYPIGIHATRQLPWAVEFGAALVVRSNDCQRHTLLSGVCSPCQLLLRQPLIKGLLDRNEHGSHVNTPFAYLTMGETQALLSKKNAQINNLKLIGLNLSRTLLVRARHLDVHSRFVHAVSQGNLPRIHSVINNSIAHGDSIFAINDRVDRAAIGALKDQSYSHAEYQKLYLLLKLGGQAAADLAHRTMGLPSINATKRHIGSASLLASPKGPTMDEMIHNLEVAYPTTFPAPPDGARGPGFQIMIDDIKVEGRMRWYPRLNQIHGICREHSKGYDLEFRSAAQAEALHAGIASGKVHLAAEGTVVAVNSFSDSPGRNIARPFIISPTCKREGKKGKDGSQRIDLEQSRCPNVANLGLGNAGKFSENRPCTNVPVHCPLLNCADVVWTYNLKSHIQRIHPGANVVAYKSYYDKHPSEKVGLKRISKTKTRTRGKKAITFRISEQHSTQSALGNSFSNAELGEDVDNDMDEDDPGDQADDDDDNQADNDCSSDFPSRLAEDSDEEMESSEPPTSEQAPISSDDPSMAYGDSALNVPRSLGHVSYGRVSSFPPDLGGRNGRNGRDLETQTSALAQDQYPQFGNQTAPPGTPAIRAMIPVHAAATRPKPRPLFKTTTAATLEQAASDPSEDAPPARSIDKLSNMLMPVLCDPIPSGGNNPGLTHLDPQTDEENDSEKRVRRILPAKRARQQAILSDDERDCDDPDCAETEGETITCSGPAFPFVLSWIKEETN